MEEEFVKVSYVRDSVCNFIERMEREYQQKINRLKEEYKAIRRNHLSDDMSPLFDEMKIVDREFEVSRKVIEGLASDIFE